MCQVERPKVIDAQCNLKVFLCPVSGGDEHSSIIHQNMQRQATLLKVLGKLSDGAASRQ